MNFQRIRRIVKKTKAGKALEGDVGMGRSDKRSRRA